MLLGLWLGFDLFSHVAAEVLWFQELGYLPAFLLRLKTQMGLWVIAFFTSASFLLGNLALAHRLKYPTVRGEQEKEEQGNSLPLELRWFLPFVLTLSVLVGLILIYYGQAALSFWHPNINLPDLLPRLSLPSWLTLQVQWLRLPLPIQIWQPILLLVLTISILVSPQFWLSAIALVITLLFGSALSQHWDSVLQYFHPTNFNRTDPLFERDISFYVFSLPIWELLKFWLLGLCLYGLVAVTLIYLLSAASLSQGKFSGFSAPQLRHLYGLGGCLMLAIALHYWLGRYELLYSTHGVAYGASYTDVIARLPVYTGLTLLAVAVSVLLLWQTTFSSRILTLRLSGSFLAVVVVASWLLPLVLQRLVVEPNELARERPYIQRSIALTRQAFALDKVEVQTFNPQGDLSAADLQENDLTIRNIRLWDTRPLLQTNRQLQQIRPYYKFPNADINRYTLESSLTSEAEKQQTIIAARELDYSAVPQQAQTWVNEHLVYTHGYGFTLSPVNTVGSGGLPDYFVKDIGVDTNNERNSSLRIFNERIRTSIPIGQPRIYYGEISDTYILTGTKAR